MEGEKQQSYYVVIPTYLFDDDRIPGKAKKLYGKIASLVKKEGFCWASNSYFSKELNCSIRTVQRYLKMWVDMGEVYCDVESKNKRKIWLKRKMGKTWGKVWE